jgi:hypothetical protein
MARFLSADHGQRDSLVADPLPFIFAGTTSMGVWKSTDGGASWHPTTGPSFAERQCSAAGPASASIIYAGLSDGAFEVHRFRRSGTGRSFPDSSEVLSWQPTGITETCSTRAPNKGSTGRPTEARAGTDSAARVGQTPSPDRPSSGHAGHGVLDRLRRRRLRLARRRRRKRTLDRHFPRVLYSYLASPIATDATGQWIYEGSQGAGIFQMSPASVVPVAEPSPREVGGGDR